jgi:excisionase family DNA binding protein
MTDDRLTFTVAEAAQLLGISRSAAYDCIRCGDLPAVRMGRRLLVPVKALEDLLSRAAA